MELLEPELKKTYDKCKYIVKVWEHKFQKEHKRLPSKLDIREANTEVRHAYRRYFQIKSAALEQSFMDIDMGFEDDPPNDESLKAPVLEENNQNELNQIKSTEIEAKPAEEEPQIDETWGAHLNNTKPKEIEEAAKQTEKPNLNITKKLFCGSKFTKRNPRKSLSFTQKKSESNIEVPAPSSQPIFTSFSSDTDLSQDSFSSSKENCSMLQENSLLNTNFKIVAPSENVTSKPVNLAQMAAQNTYKKTLKSVDTGWLERVARQTGTKIEEHEMQLLKEQQPVADNFNFPNLKTPSVDNVPSTNVVTKLDYDSDDIIDGSDDEEPVKLPPSLHVAKKKRMEISNISRSNSLNSMSSFNDGNNSSLNVNSTEISSGGINMSENNVSTNQNTEETMQVSTEEIATSDKKKPRKSTSRNVKKTTPKAKAKTTKKVKEMEERSPTRRSSRQTKVKVSLEELSSGEEDPFASDNDEGDPEFTPNSPKPHYEDNNESLEAKPKRSRKSTAKEKTPRQPKTPKAPKTPRVPKSAKAKKEEKNVEEEEPEDAPYDVEFSVKPRIVAPRYGSIKTVIKERKIKIKSEDNKTKSKKEKVEDKIKDRTQQAADKLEQKIASGNLNENFVRLNLKKKVFARGKSGINFSKYKKAQWKQKKKALAGPDMDMGGCDGGMLTCFNCGQIGHFARHCKATKGEGLLPLSAAAEEEDCPYPTLEEAAALASNSVLSIRKPNIVTSEEKMDVEESEATVNPEERDNGQENDEEAENDNDEEAENDDDVNDEEAQDGDEFDSFDEEESDLLLAETLRIEENAKKLNVQMYMDSVKYVKSYYELKEDDSVIETPQEVFDALRLFGHASFRGGQEQAVMRILSGKSTLVTLSTGSGKSLCYQLPAYLYARREPCISLIISPLVSLMEDQVHGIPSFLRAACLHTNQTKNQREKVMQAISMGDLDVLLISPEAVVAGERQTGFGSLFRKLPPIAFACIDEAHCVSQWSHNFRPSYLMICRVLRESLGVKTILGLTATATRSTSDSIIEHLHIPDGRDGIISDIPLPDNLTLTVSKDAQRDQALLGLLLSERFADCRSIIVYCTRRDECERIATFLRTSLKNEKVVEETNKKRKRVNLQAEPYHAGLSASRRRTIQNSFMSGALRIVVATVAFGMGINKSDIRAVIHYNMPKSFESYVQEVGRAGRDGLKAHCHLFLDSMGRDENELRRHIHSNSIDRHVIRKLLQKIFIPCSCKTTCPKHEVGFSIEETVRALDIPEENISTLLCYLELHENKYIQVLSPAYTWCKVISYGGPLQIRKAAKDCAPLAMALALHKTQQGDDPNTLEFPVIDIASAMGWESGICKHKLKNLEWTTVNNQPKRSPLTVRFSNLGFRLFAPGNLTDDQLDEALDSLYSRVVEQERTAILQLRAVHDTLIEVANKSYRACLNEEGEEAAKLKLKVREYFNSVNPLASLPEIKPKKVNEEQLINDIRAIIHMYRDNSFTGRAIARIFHGIQSPNYPAVMWGRCKFWRSHISDDFHTICRIATQEILRMK